MTNSETTLSTKTLAVVGAVAVVLLVTVIVVARGTTSEKSSASPVTSATQAQQPSGAATLPTDESARADLRNALTAEKVNYVDTQQYTDSSAQLELIEPVLGWNTPGGVQVFVGDVQPGDQAVVCVQQSARSGAIYAIADVATGPSVGTYYNTGPCSTDAAKVAAWTG